MIWGYHYFWKHPHTSRDPHTWEKETFCHFWGKSHRHVTVTLHHRHTRKKLKVVQHGLEAQSGRRSAAAFFVAGCSEWKLWKLLDVFLWNSKAHQKNKRSPRFASFKPPTFDNLCPNLYVQISKWKKKTIGRKIQGQLPKETTRPRLPFRSITAEASLEA